MAKVTLADVRAQFEIPNYKLQQIMKHIDESMDEGLENSLNASTIAMLPSFVPEFPNGTEEGKFVAMDLGGTNLRIMLVIITPGKDLEIHQETMGFPKTAMHGNADDLFDFIAKKLTEFLGHRGLAMDNLPVGFTFSYPCDQISINRSVLIRWAKGFKTSGVIGQEVVGLLENAIKKRSDLKVKIVAILNDAVGTLVAAAYDAAGVCHLGVVIGSGTNAAYMEDVSRMKYKMSKTTMQYPYSRMIVDIEWGAFGDDHDAHYFQNEFDYDYNSRCEHPDNYTFDKLVGGRAMGELVRLVLVKLANSGVIFDGKASDRLTTMYSFPTKYIFEILSDTSEVHGNTRQVIAELGIGTCRNEDVDAVREVCLFISRRSAHLIAAAIACVLNRIKKPDMVVGIDGSTFKYHPHFSTWIHDKVEELIEPGYKFRMVCTSDGSGRGAALIAAIATRLNMITE